MRHLPTVAGILLGLLFIMAGGTFLLGLVPKMDPPPAGSWPAMFMGSFAASGWLHVVKVLELVGGVLVAIPRLRNLGLLILGPIIVNILAYHACIIQGKTLLDPMLALVVALALYLLWVERRAFAGLVKRP